MSGRKPKTKRRPWTAALTAAVGSALAGTALLDAPLFAQDNLPKLPPTKVEGTPTPTTQTQPPAQPQPSDTPNPNDFPQPDNQGPNATPSISQGGAFASPPAVGYRAESSTTATIANVPNIDFPGTVSVVPAQLINDQQALTIPDLLRNIPGAIRLGDSLRPDSFTLRGFEVKSRDYRWNGFLDPTPTPRDFANVQRVEILQGPASVLYGSGGAGGLVNIITKKPLEERYNAVTVMGGNNGLIRPTLDVTGPVGDGAVLYRFNSAYENNDGFRDFSFLERNIQAPVVTWVVDDYTAITFEGQYVNDRRRFDTGVAQFNGQLILPIRRYLDQPDNRLLYNDYKTSVWLNHKFDEGWFGRIGVAGFWWDTPTATTPPILKGNNPAIAFLGLPQTTLIQQTQNTVNFREQSYSAIADLTGKFCTGPVNHSVVLGTEVSWFRSTDLTAQLSDPLTLTPNPFPVGPPFFPSPTQTINAQAPVYNTTTPPLPGRFDQNYIQERYGWYAQDLAEITEHIKFLAGARADVDRLNFDREFISPFGGQDIGFPRVKTDTMYYRWSPRVGLVYQPLPEELSFYVSYSESFELPDRGAFRNPQPLKPELGESFEGGVKVDLLDKQLSVTVSGFHIDKSNVVTQDSAFFSTQIGRQRSMGVEMSAVGKVTEELSIVANYTYLDSRIVNSIDPLQVGNRFRNVPFNSGNIWSRYNLVHDDCQTLGVALGMVAVGDRLGDLQGTFALPGYVRWDSGVYYQRGPLSATVYFENIFGRTYYSSSVDSLTVYPGQPFNLRAQVGVTF